VSGAVLCSVVFAIVFCFWCFKLPRSVEPLSVTLCFASAVFIVRTLFSCLNLLTEWHPWFCRGYVGIHSSGFRDFLLKPELLRAIVDCGFEHPSEGTISKSS
jgi:hypothetical protein